MTASPGSRKHGAPFQEALKIENLGRNTYKAKISPEYCYGPCKLYSFFSAASLGRCIDSGDDFPVANGGYVVSIFQSTVSLHFKSMGNIEPSRVLPISLHVEFLRRTLVGEAILKIEDVKIGTLTSTAHIIMNQGQREKARGYATYETSPASSAITISQPP